MPELCGKLSHECYQRIFDLTCISNTLAVACYKHLLRTWYKKVTHDKQSHIDLFLSSNNKRIRSVKSIGPLPSVSLWTQVMTWKRIAQKSRSSVKPKRADFQKCNPANRSAFLRDVPLNPGNVPLLCTNGARLLCSISREKRGFCSPGRNLVFRRFDGSPSKQK